MKAAPFVYHRPGDIDQALHLLAQHAGEDGRVIAGGQSLVPIMAFRLSRPAHLIDINRVAGLDRLDIRDGKLCIGALVRHAAFEQPAAPGPLGRLLARVAHDIAHAPIRTRGTFCGSVAHADPASEWCLVAATLDAEMVARSTRGARVIPAASFFAGIMSTALAPDELLAEIRLSLLPDQSRVGFAEFSRRAGDFAMAASACVLRITDGRVVEARVGVGGAEPAPRRVPEAEAALHGRPLDAAAIEAASEAAARAIDPLEDAQTDALYRRDLVRAMTRRALAEAMSDA